MSVRFGTSESSCEQADLVYAFALQSIPTSKLSEVETHLAECSVCRAELESLRPVMSAFVEWPIDVLRPSTDLWPRLAERIGAEPGQAPASANARRPWQEPEWEEVAPGISCKILATDLETSMVSMLVRLAPGGEYPPHRHAGVEELHLLDGELWINDRKLHPGDCNRAEPGTSDVRVWSETGCTCVLITSFRDELA
jgi:quercetin dioxygenase-like cupin family protein